MRMHLRVAKHTRTARQHAMNPRPQEDMTGHTGALAEGDHSRAPKRGSILQMTNPTDKEKDAVEAVFEELLSDANGELAKLLWDVRTGAYSHDTEPAQVDAAKDLVMRAIRCAAKQYMLQAELGSLALMDGLTGLYNRRAFEALAERQLKLARRFGRSLLLFFVDVDGLKQINDSLGHIQGDLALKRTARILERTFRDSDVIARMGGDEFAALAVEASGESEEAILGRLRRFTRMSNAEETAFALSLSVGMARFDRRCSISIMDLMARADQAMYEDKHRQTMG